MRFTKIIATVGPASSSPDVLAKLMDAGVNVLRLNLSHGDHRHHARVIRAIRDVRRSLDRPVAIMLDTKGPEVRTRDVARPIPIRKGDIVLFTHRQGVRSGYPVIPIDHPGFARDARNARTILLDNGVLEFKRVRVGRDGVLARALEDGSIGSRRHVNLPGVPLSLPTFTQRDRSDIHFGIAHGADFFALSFVREAKDVTALRRLLRRGGSAAQIVAKIETPLAVKNLSSIIDAADAVMVARGDLGAEVPFESVPRIQEEIVRECQRKGKPVIIATQMLESMIGSPMPTRAEVTDVAHAAITSADAVMLSGETASGLYPVRAVQAMHRILRENERGGSAYPFVPPMPADDGDLPRWEQALAASVLATNVRAKALLVFSRHGLTAKAVSQCRPHVPILAFTPADAAERQLQLVWGITPFTVPFSKRPDRTVAHAMKLIASRRLVKAGDRIVIVSDIRSAAEPVMTIQIRTVRSLRQ